MSYSIWYLDYKAVTVENSVIVRFRDFLSFTTIAWFQYIYRSLKSRNVVLIVYRARFSTPERTLALDP